MYAFEAADQIAAALFAFALLVAVLNGADELFLDALWLWVWASGKLRDPPTPVAGTPERHVAIFVPLWREHAVIGDMLAHNVAAIRYDNYDFFVGCYPNDALTVEAVEAASARWPRVHVAMVPHDGPTSKGDCLNAIYGRMLLHEQSHNSRYDIVVLHDAEDLIHPEELATAAADPSDDFIQVPVLPLPTPPWHFTHGVHCDEFALAHPRDMTVRSALGGFVPSAGVGTALSRRAVDELARSGQLFDPACLTEDYETGFRLYKAGMRQRFVVPRHRPDGLFATREYFPSTWTSAVRQRERWVTGIVFQGWERDKWMWAQGYWLWRDRKGPLVNLTGALSTILFVYGLIGIATRGLSAHAWFGRAALAAVAVQTIHLSVRAACVWRWYGPAMALTVWARQVYADTLNVCAAVRAMRACIRSKRLQERIEWRKTAHAFPVGAALPHRMSNATRAIPKSVAARWRVAPMVITAGEILLAADSPPDPAAEADIRRYTSLRIRIQLVDRQTYESLTAADTPTKQKRRRSAGATSGL